MTRRPPVYYVALVERRRTRLLLGPFAEPVVARTATGWARDLIDDGRDHVQVVGVTGWSGRPLAGELNLDVTRAARTFALLPATEPGR